jgi:lipopolysaccharide transport protein LptA
MPEASPLGPTGETSPFRIMADRAEKLLERNAILYSGNAVARGEEVTIRAESIMLTMDANDVPTEMVARDEVVIRKGGNELFGKRAVWSPTQKTIVLTEDAKIRQPGGVWTRGDEITLHLDTGRVEITGATPMEGTEERPTISR